MQKANLNSQSGPSKAAIWAALLAVYIVWGSTYLAIRFAVASMPPFLMAATRFLVAGSILYAWRRLAGDSAPRRFEWRSAAVVGLLLLLGGNGGVVWAEQRVASGVAALLVGGVPLWIVLIEAARPGGQRPGRMTLAGVLAGFAGIALLIGPGQLAGDGHAIDPLGTVALLAGSFLWAAGSLYGRSARLPASPLLGTGMEMLAGGAGLLLAGTLAGEWGRLDLAAITLSSLAGLGYLIFFGSLVGFASYTWLLRVAPTSLVSTYAYVNPLIAILVGSLLAQEPLTLRILVSALVIVSSVALINLGRTRQPQLEGQVVAFNPSSGDD
jgi:drug/metabolite transporter (DMT)-like permease